jgi:diacylglycerol kinase (ATP)
LLRCLLVVAQSSGQNWTMRVHNSARFAVIVNRMAHKGGAARRWPTMKSELEKRLGPVQPLFTEGPGHATALAREALAQGARRFIAVGGDGTANETLNGLIGPDGRLLAPDAALCPIPAGTANELCRALGYLGDTARAYDAAAGTGSRAIDLIRVRCAGLDGRPIDRFGYLIASVGGAAEISHRTSRSRWLKKFGEIAYLLMTPIVTLGYRPRVIALSIDGAPAASRKIFTAMVANTENGGGGMKLAPGARFDDGILDLVEVEDTSKLAILFGILPKTYSGAYIHHPGVRVSSGKLFRFDSDLETLVDLDGETVGKLPLEVSVLPKAFNVGVAIMAP